MQNSVANGSAAVLPLKLRRLPTVVSLGRVLLQMELYKPRLNFWMPPSPPT